MVVLRIILSKPGIYLAEVQSELLAMFGTTISISTICRTLRYMGCTRQVIQQIAIQRSDEKRAEFMAEVSAYDLPCSSGLIKVGVIVEMLYVSEDIVLEE